MHRAERSDALADALADILVDPLPDPFAAEIVAVPAKGVERWLAQSLATRLGVGDPAAGGGSDGVAANIDFCSVGDLVDGVIAAARGHRLDEDPWAPARVLWQMARALGDCVDDPACAVLARHLGRAGGEPDRRRVGRWWTTARHLQRLFRGYAAARPELIVDWSRGHDTDGAGAELADDLLWQPRVWRALRARIASPAPSEELAPLCARLEAEPGICALPPRLALFGPTRLSAEHLSVLSAVARRRDVHLFLTHPCDELWHPGGLPGPVRRRDAPGRVPANPLLASLSREAREAALVLAGRADRDELHPVTDDGSTTVLARLQRSIRSGADPASLVAAPIDESVAFHSCHGPARQVEVARDLIAAMFADDPGLTPRDVIVMCPDVEAFAPLIRAAFGQHSTSHPAHRFRVRMADRSMTATNDVLDVVVRVVSLAGGRLTATEIADLAATPAIRRRFGFADDDVQTITGWLGRANVRWGLGARQRHAFGLGDFPQNTMSTGLDRLVLGVVADESTGWINRALPLSEIDSGDIDLVGRLDEFVTRLQRCVERVSGTQTVARWREALIGVVELLAEPDRARHWQGAQAISAITAATEHGDEVELRREDVVALLDDVVAARPTRANFRSGELTVCSLVPMRTVPHRAVVLLGLDDDTFPRTAVTDGDDVLLREPLVGERDPRAEDRQLLLDTIMSARERLVVCFTGADPVSGLRRPPSVPVSELIDTVRALVPPEHHDGVIRRHPLHAFDQANFAGDPPSSFDTLALEGARALCRPARRSLSFDRTVLAPPAAATDIDVADLVAFFEHPVRAFCRQRLGVVVPETADVLTDAMTPTLDPLDRWQIGDRLMTQRMSGTDQATLRGSELRRGSLPPFGFGLIELDRVLDGVERIHDACGRASGSPRTAVDVDVDLGDGRRIVGTVDGVGVPDGVDIGVADGHGAVVLRPLFSRLAAKHRVAAWIALCALVAGGRLQAAPVARIVGRAPFGTRVATSDLTAPADPVTVLRTLVSIRDHGLREPLPIPCAAAERFAARHFAGADRTAALEAARSSYGDTYGEHLDRYHRLVFGDDFASVVGDGARFADLSRDVWFPLLQHESVVTR